MNSRQNPTAATTTTKAGSADWAQNFRVERD
jgi:hypothetical protein